MKPFRAKFYGECEGCYGAIDEGDEVIRLESCFYHSDCLAEEFEFI